MTVKIKVDHGKEFIEVVIDLILHFVTLTFDMASSHYPFSILCALCDRNEEMASYTTYCHECDQHEVEFDLLLENYWDLQEDMLYNLTLFLRCYN
jgi:hypothetical protein